MPIRANSIGFLSLSCIALALSGCSTAEDMPPAQPAPPAASHPAPATSAAGANGESRPASGSRNASGPSPAAAAQFTPPFPGRFELFEPPKRATNTVRRDEERGETVELKGFIHVDRPRVVLSIDGVITPLGEGDEKYGVQVLSISPPSAVLQRGRDRWTTTLE